MDELETQKRNARRREKYANDAEHRERRRQQANAWKEENRESYRLQQREAARRIRSTPEGLERHNASQRRHYAANTQSRLAATKAWRDQHPGYHSRWHAKNRKKNPVLYMWRNSRNRAKALGLEFTLQQSDIVIPETCPVLGFPLTFNHGKKGFFANESPSIDRFDNAKGYTKENIRVISWRANMLKRDATVDEIERLLAYMKGAG